MGLAHGRRLLAALALVAAAAGTSWGLEPSASPNVRADRQQLNGGSGTPNSTTFRARPAIIGQGLVGRSTSANRVINHGGIGALTRPFSGAQDIYVRSTWNSQADVLADATVGPGGCITPPQPLIYGNNALNSISLALSNVADGGRIRLLNGTYTEEELEIARAVEIVGVDESVAGCSGEPGLDGVLVQPAAGDPSGKAIFRVTTGDVTMSDFRVSGDNPAPDDVLDADHGLLFVGTLSNIDLRRMRLERLAAGGIRMVAAGATGLVIEDVEVDEVGATAGGAADGTAILLAGVQGTVSGGSISNSSVGLRVVGSGVAGLPPTSGSGVFPVVDVTGLVGDAITGSAISLEGGARGSVTLNNLEGCGRGIVVEGFQSDESILIEDNTLAGPMNIGIDVRDVFGATAGGDALVTVRGNSVAPPVQVAAFAVRYVGRSTSAARPPGRVVLEYNSATALAGNAASPSGIFVHGVAPATGVVEIVGNTLSGLSAVAADAGVRVSPYDTISGDNASRETAGITLEGGSISTFNRGVEVGSRVALVGQKARLTLSQSTDVPLANNTDGIILLLDGEVTAGSSTNGPLVSGGTRGVVIGGLNTTATLRNASLTGMVTGIDVANRGNLSLRDSFIEPRTAAGTIGVRLGSANAVVDLGGGSLGSPGNNVINTRAGGWGVTMSAAGTYSATNNEWRLEGTTFVAAVAVDDLIRDGDIENTAAGGEGATVGPLHFLPFVGAVETAPVQVDDDYRRGLTPGYGVTRFRELSDGIDTVTPLGAVSVLAGNYRAIRHDVLDSSFDIARLVVAKPMTIEGEATASVTVFPAANGPGTNGAVLDEPATITLFEVAASDVTFQRLSMEADSPAISGGVSDGGRDINARNAILLDGSIPGGADNLTVDEVRFSRFFRSAVGVEGIATAGQLSEGLQVLSCSFVDNGGTAGASNFGSSLALVEARGARVESSTFSGGLAGIELTCTDDDSDTVVQGCTFTGGTQAAVLVRSATGTGTLEVAGNSLTLAPTALSLSGAAGPSYAVTFEGNTVARPSSLGAVRVTGLEGGSTLAILDNDFTATGSGLGVLVNGASAPSGDAVLVEANLFNDLQQGVVVRATDTTTPSTQVRMVANTLNSLTDGVIVESSVAPGAALAELMLGGMGPGEPNTFTSSTIAVRVQGSAARAAIVGDGEANPRFTTQVVALIVDNGAAVTMLNTAIVGSFSAALQVGSSSEVLLQSCWLDGDTNGTGVRILGDARVSMGPGAPANFLTNPFFGGVESTGFNRMRFYETFTPFRVAIFNESDLDQNAENNDFGLGVCFPGDPGPTPTIEEVVVHQPDNGLGFVDFCPPLDPFTRVDDWAVLEALAW